MVRGLYGENPFLTSKPAKKYFKKELDNPPNVISFEFIWIIMQHFETSSTFLKDR